MKQVPQRSAEISAAVDLPSPELVTRGVQPIPRWIRYVLSDLAAATVGQGW